MTKRLLKFLTSLKFGIILFIVIAIYSVIGTVLPQGLANDYYIQNYNSMGNIIVLLQFNNVYSSIIYRGILLVFIINLVGCTLNILPAQLRRMSDTYFPTLGQDKTNLNIEGMNHEELKAALIRKRFKITTKDDGFVAAKNRIGNIGSSVTHLGIVIILLGGFIGNVFAEDGFFNMLPGESRKFDKYGFTLALDDFYLGFREDGSTEQYYSEFSIYEGGNKVGEKKIWVNNPLSHKKIDFFQSSFGWASTVVVSDQDGNILYEGIMKDDQHYFYQPEHLTVYLYGFFPDFNINQEGQPFTMTQQLKHPHFAVILYQFNEYLDSYIIEPGQAIDYKDIKIEFKDPTLYTGITYRKDFGYIFVLLVSAILIMGLILSFYLYPRYLYVSPNNIVPLTRQNSWGYEMQIKNMLNNLNNIKGD